MVEMIKSGCVTHVITNYSYHMGTHSTCYLVYLINIQVENVTSLIRLLSFPSHLFVPVCEWLHLETG